MTPNQIKNSLIAPRLLATLCALCALGYLAGGVPLARLGGSPYYAVAGIALFVTAGLLWRGSGWSGWIFGALLASTLGWTWSESGLNPWAMVPRLSVLIGLGMLFLLPPFRRGLGGSLPPSAGLAARIGLTAAVVVMIGAAALIEARAGLGSGAVASWPQSPDNGADWPNYGNTPAGTRYSALDQITPANVGTLKVKWTYNFGEQEPYGLQVTPLKIGDSLYACTSRNRIVDLDPDSGKEIWSYDPEVNLDNVPFRACRGVGYYKVPNASGHCAERIYTQTADARVIAVDARDGKLCEGFGVGGQVSMLDGLGPVIKGYYYMTSAPVIARGRLVLGATIMDNQYWGEPSGVIRAIDAVTGQLAWAYDVGQPDRIGAPGPGETYTLATPNSWAPMSFDDTRGLVYVPTGNATPDYYGAQRRPFDDEISSAVMALDIETGRRRWVFQTVHHDLWDYDVPAQPVLFDLPGKDGAVPALAQGTKQGQLFLLNRVTGQPIAAVEERPVPQAGSADGERLSPTQPFSALPSVAGENLTEAMMWGLTPFDQMWCRSQFRQARYEGPMTPPGLTPSIQYPGYLGGMDWGGASVDTSRGIIVTVASHVANYVHLVPRAEADAQGVLPAGTGGKAGATISGLYTQSKTPFAAVTHAFLSPIDVPCQQPPWSRLSAIDLGTQKLLWSRPLGNGKQNGPWGIKSGLPFEIGVPALGGAMTTRSGLTFVGASIDRTFRAVDTATGRSLWEADLPESGNAVPITFLSPRTGRQIVVIAAGGHKILGTKNTDAIVAFALPE